MRSSVADVMTKRVIIARERTAYKAIVGLIQDNDVSALPVVDDDGRVVGIVSEGDLILKEERLEHRRALLRSAKERIKDKKMSASVARDLMTMPVVSVRPDAPLTEAARLMHRHGVKSLPVVDAEDHLVGIVSRKDLLKVYERPDGDIKREVVENVLQGQLWLTSEDAAIKVDVEDGIVCLEGWVDRKSLLDIVLHSVLGVEGVVDIDDRLSFKSDDTRARPQVALPWGVLPQALRRP